jgi:PII-like signaling protein
MQGTYLIFFVQEDRKHHGALVYEWLLKQAQRLGLQGGTAFKAIAGFGRHRHLHADHFIELAGDLSVEVTFMATNEEAERLMAFLQAEGLSLFYLRMPAEYGFINELVPPRN